MKVLSIIQPWASLIAVGIKDIENRTWKTNYRGKILLHASASVANKDWSILSPAQREAAKALICPFGVENSPLNLGRSAIIGEATLVDCVIGHSSIWAEKDVWNWVLKDMKLFSIPTYNVKGKLNLWDFDESKLISKNYHLFYETIFI